MIPANPWMDIARSYIGLREIKGPSHESKIIAMFDAIKCAWFKDDETPWCAGYVGACLERAGIRSSRSAAARSYEAWGQPIEQAALGWAATQIPYGAVMVLSSPGRGAASGHVTFYSGPSGSGWAGLGGNQDDAVNVASFLWSRIVAVRWPTGYALPAKPYRFPDNPSDMRASTSDA